MALDAGPSFVEIVRQRAAVGTAIGHFCYNYGLYFVLSWLPLYLVQERGFSIARMATFGGAVYLVQAAAAWAGPRRLEPERRAQDDRDRLLGPRPPPPDRLDAAAVGGGRALPP